MIIEFTLVNGLSQDFYDHCDNLVEKVLTIDPKLQKLFDQTDAEWEDSGGKTIKFGILGRFLNVIDDLSRAVENVPDDVNEDWDQGISLVLRNLENALEMEGVTKVDSLGEHFDPHLHDALMFEETEDYNKGNFL